MSVSWWSWLLLAVSSACAGNRAPTESPMAIETSATAAEPGLPEVVATIGGKPVTRDELYEESAAALVEAEVALYQARREAIDGLVLRKVVEAEAAKRGMTVDQLVEAEVSSKVTPVTDAEVEAFYAQNKGRIQGSLDEVRPQVTTYLEQERHTEAAHAYFDKLRHEAKVEILLPPHRVDVQAGDSPRWGKPDAPVQIIEFSDFQCPYCSRAANTIEEVKHKYGDKVSIVYRHFPLPMHKQAHRAAEAAACADEQDGFWKFHDALFADQKAWTDADFASYAKSTGLDADKLTECVESGRQVASVDVDVADGKKAGMGGTPGFYINGVVLTGAQPLAAFTDVIDAELAAR